MIVSSNQTVHTTVGKACEVSIKLHIYVITTNPKQNLAIDTSNFMHFITPSKSTTNTENSAKIQVYVNHFMQIK